MIFHLETQTTLIHSIFLLVVGNPTLGSLACKGINKIYT